MHTRKYLNRSKTSDFEMSDWISGWMSDWMSDWLSDWFRIGFVSVVGSDVGSDVVRILAWMYDQMSARMLNQISNRMSGMKGSARDTSASKNNCSLSLRRRSNTLWSDAFTSSAVTNSLSGS